MSRDVGRFFRTEEGDRVGYIFWRPDSSERNRFQRVLPEIVGESGSHGGFDEPWRDRVASYVARPDLAGDGHGQTDQAGFRRRIVGLASLTHLAEDRRYVDDSTPTLLEHRADHLLNAQIGRGQICIENGIPVGALHAHDELVTSNPCVVDE